jgi:primosomal protein N' (replication factor Y)
LGIGSELIEQEINRLFPDMTVFRLDSDTASSHKRACEIADRFMASPGSVMIGTEMALPYITDKIQNSAIVSMDSFFSMPDFRINERIINIILKIRSLTTRCFILQTRNPEQKVLDYAIKGNLSDFYREEISARKELAYPPFSAMVKISLVGTKAAVIAEMEKLQTTLEPYQIDVFPAFVPGPTGKLIMNGLLKIPRESWPDRNLLDKLRNLPPVFSIDVEPESLL